MSGTDAASPSAGASSSAAAPAPRAPAGAGEFVQQRLAAVAALPPEQRSFDEAAFLRGHELLAASQASLAAMEGEGEPAFEDRLIHTAVAALTLLGGLEELAGVGTQLQLLLSLSHDALRALDRHADVLSRDARAGQLFPCVALHPCDLARALLQYSIELQLASTRARPAGVRPGNVPDPAAELRRLQGVLFSEVSNLAIPFGIQMLPLFTALPAGGLPGLDQLRRLWAVLAFDWALPLAEGVGRPPWMAGFPGPTPNEARQLVREAVDALRRLAPDHPLLGRMEAQCRLGQQGAAESSLRRGLELAAAAGGPHGASLLEAEYCYGLITTCAPAPNTPPWGRLSLADAAQLLQRGDAAWARCKALLPPVYRLSVKHLRGMPSLQWRRAAVERHQRAGAAEWRQDLLAAEPAQHDNPNDRFSIRRIRHPACACCGTEAAELRVCSGCKLPGAKYCSKECQTRHWPQHKPECRAARAAAAQPGQAAAAGEGAGTR